MYRYLDVLLDELVYLICHWYIRVRISLILNTYTKGLIIACFKTERRTSYRNNMRQTKKKKFLKKKHVL